MYKKLSGVFNRMIGFKKPAKLRKSPRKAGRRRPKETRSPWSLLIGKFYNLPTLQVVATTVIVLTGATVSMEPDLTLAQRLSPMQIFRTAFDNAESIAIVSAVVIYLKETPDRKIRQQSELFNIFASSAKFPNNQVRVIVLEKLNSEGVPLGLYDFSGIANLSGAQFPNADMCAADFHGVSLRKANLENALLCTTIFRSANLHSANLQDSNLWKANLEDSTLTHANLVRANLTESNLFRANLQGANLVSAYLRKANLCDAKLQGADLSNADLREADLTGTNLKQAILDGVSLKHAYFNNTTMPNGLIWNEAKREFW